MIIVEDRPQAGGQAAARKAMLDSQLRTSGINAAYALARMGEVAREDFVPAAAAADGDARRGDLSGIRRNDEPPRDHRRASDLDHP